MIKALRGTYDILPPETTLWQKVEQKTRELFESYGYGEIRTPVFERTELFTRSIGEATDIVEKEMYTFQDRKGRSCSLRPEATACVVRACLEHKLLNQQGKIHKFFYIGPMFRYDRPQAGRQRQFNQVGVELFGSYSPLADAEVITMMVRFFESLGLKNISVNVNSLGDKESVENYKNKLKEFIQPKLGELCSDCNRRFEKNILRLLDCKVPSCKEIFGSPEMPVITNSLSDVSLEHYKAVLSALKDVNVNFVEEPGLVRGLDYYTETIFEITHNSIGAQSALGGGGRYNNLVKEIGGPATGAVGFAIGVERLILALKQLDIPEEDQKEIIYLVSFDEEAIRENLVFADELRKKGLTAITGYQKLSVKAQMRQANNIGAKFVVMRGEDERVQDSVKVKNMETGEEKITPVQDLADDLIPRGQAPTIDS